MNHGNPANEEAKGTWYLYPSSGSHPFVSFKRMHFAQRWALFKRERAGFWKYSSRSDHFQETQNVSSENGSSTLWRAHILVTKSSGSLGGGYFLGSFGLKGRVIKLVVIVFVF